MSSISYIFIASHHLKSIIRGARSASMPIRAPLIKCHTKVDLNRRGIQSHAIPPCWGNCHNVVARPGWGRCPSKAQILPCIFNARSQALACPLHGPFNMPESAIFTERARFGTPVRTPCTYDTN